MAWHLLEAPEIVPHLEKVLCILDLILRASDVDDAVRSSGLQLINGDRSPGLHADLLDPHSTLANDCTRQLITTTHTAK